MLVAGLIAAVSATALIFIAAHQNPVRRDAAMHAPPSRAAVNATEERKIWSRRAADTR